MRALRLAPVLLALAACTVNTDSLKPKSAAECAVHGQKACGNRCMPITLENGCGEPGCRACPAPPQGWEGYCDGGAPSTCATRVLCPTGSAYCEGPYDTTCENLAADASHCGACGHSCHLSACTGGLCAATVAGTVPGSQDLATDGTSVFQLVKDSPSVGVASVLKDLLPFATFSGRASRLEADGNGFVAWDRSAGSTVYAAGPTGTPVTSIFSPAGTPVSSALDPAYVYFVQTGGTLTGQTPADLLGVDRTTGAAYPYTFAGETLWAVAIAQPGSTTSDALVGTVSGNLRWVSWDGTREGLYASGIDVPIRLVVFEGPVGPAALSKKYAFWLGSSGALYRKELPSGPVDTLVQPVGTTSTYLDLHADADGVYWVDATPGYTPFVAEWRAAHDDLVQLAAGDAANPPARVTATLYTSPAKVWWLTTNGALYSVPR